MQMLKRDMRGAGQLSLAALADYWRPWTNWLSNSQE
jgi:hypothetical protein